MNAVGESASSSQVSATPAISSGGLVSIADAYVRNGSYGNTNYGADTILTVKLDGTGYAREGFLKFNVAGLANAQSVILQLVAVFVDATVPALKFEYVANDSWTESGIAWNTKPTGSGVILAQVTGFQTNVPISVDVTNQAKIEAVGDGVFSIRISSTTTGSSAGINFGSKEQTNSNLRPQLIATFAPVAPNSPTNVSAIASSAGQVNLSWSSVSGATSYTVKRAATIGGPYASIASGLSSATYADTNVTAGATYYYVVDAVNAGGSSADSAEANAFVPKIAASITLGGLSQAYDGLPKSATASTNPANLAVALTYNGSSAPPVSAGTYSVSANITDPSYTGTVSTLFTITQAPATVVIIPSNGSIASYAAAIGQTIFVRATGGTTAVVYGSGMYGINSDIDTAAVHAGVLTSGQTAVLQVNILAEQSNYIGCIQNGVTSKSEATAGGAYQIVGIATSGFTFGPTTAGAFAISATIVDPNYAGSGTTSLTITQVTPTITWSVPAAITYGTVLNSNQLDAAATTSGSFVYTPAAETVLNAGSNQPLSVIFTPSDAIDYTTATASTAITVNPAVATLSLSALTQTYDGSTKSISVVTTPSGLPVSVTYNGSATGPMNAGTYTVAVMVTDPNYTGSISDVLSINPAPATIALGNLSAVYDGSGKLVSVATAPANLAVSVTYNGSAVPINAGTYAVAATVTDPNYVGSTSGTLTISKAATSVMLGNLSQTYNGSAKSISAITTPSGLPVSVTYNGGETAINAGSYAVVATVTDSNYIGNATGTLVIGKATAAIALGSLNQMYDGTTKNAMVGTTPSGLTVNLTYNGNSTAPFAPGTYAVVGTISDSNYAGSATGTLAIGITALVNHVPSINGGISGSIQVLSAESTTLNGGAYISGDLIVPGTPTIHINGNPTYVGVRSGSGSASPTGYIVTLNGNSVLRYFVRQVDPGALPAVSAPPSPPGTQDTTLNSSAQSISSFSTLRNLTLNGNIGQVIVPDGTYGSFIANSGSGFTFGIAGATEPSVYNLQGLTLNGGSQLLLVGPVILNVGNSIAMNGSVGDSTHPEWLKLNVSSGGVTLNGNVTLNGSIVAPNGTVTINGSSTLNGQVSSGGLTINGNGLLNQKP